MPMRKSGLGTKLKNKGTGKKFPLGDVKQPSGQKPAKPLRGGR